MGASFHALLVFLLTAGLLGAPGGLVYLMRHDGPNLPTVALVWLSVAVAIGVVTAALFLKRKLRLRPGHFERARHARVLEAVELIGSEKQDLVLRVYSQAFADEMLRRDENAKLRA
jgi:hypothetical protein